MELIKEIEEAIFLDPYTEFRERKLTIERRIHPLTKRTGRVISFRFRIPEAFDLEPVIEKSFRVLCPFCPDELERRTPKFPPEISKEGRIMRGQAILVPNFFPYERYSAVARLTELHFIGIKDFEKERLLDGFLVSLDYLKRIKSSDPEIGYGSINWNYMPPAGGGMVHPHLQTVASHEATQYMDQVVRASREYMNSHGSYFWKDYIEEEERRGERFIGRIGKVTFLAPFVSMNMMGEVMAIFEGHDSALEESKDCWASFSEGLIRILRGFGDLNFTSFNMAVYLFIKPQTGLWSHARIVPRTVVPPLGTSDVNYYEKLHHETFCVLPPENMCSIIARLFTDCR